MEYKYYHVVKGIKWKDKIATSNKRNCNVNNIYFYLFAFDYFYQILLRTCKLFKSPTLLKCFIQLINKKADSEFQHNTWPESIYWGPVVASSSVLYVPTSNQALILSDMAGYHDQANCNIITYFASMHNACKVWQYYLLLAYMTSVVK